MERIVPMNAKISVIVPVYNVEKYLKNSIDSILNQTYENFEIILVDDGSTDCCPEICDCYAKKNDNIRVLHKINGGLSDARNAGLKVAKGDYVTFIDSDDYVHPFYLEVLMHALVLTNADIAVVGIKCVYDVKNMDSIKISDIPIIKYPAKAALCKILYQQFHDVSANGILLSRNLANKYFFPLGKKFEDLFTTYKYYLASNTVAFIFQPLYYYFQRNDSIMRGRDEKTFDDWIESSNCLVQNCGFDTSIEKAAINKQFSNFKFLILLLYKYKKIYPRQYETVATTLKSNKLKILLDCQSTFANKIAAISLFWGIKGLRFLYYLKRM